MIPPINSRKVLKKRTGLRRDAIILNSSEREFLVKNKID